jgi:hypothetical protein
MPPETLVSLALLAAVAAAILLSSRRQSARPLALIAATTEGGWRIHRADTVDAYRANADLLAALPGFAKTHRIILTDPARTRLAALPLTPTERKLLDLPCG